MKKVKWFLSVFLAITMLMSSFVAAVGETLEEGQPAAQTTETDGGGGGGGHDRTTSGGGGHANTKTGGSSKHDHTETVEGGRHDNTETREGGKHNNNETREGGKHDNTGAREGGGHDNPDRHDNTGTGVDGEGGNGDAGTGEGGEGGNGDAGTGEGGEGGNGNAGIGEGGEHDNPGIGEDGEDGNGNNGTGEGENEPIDLTGENGDEGEELMLLGAALLMTADALLDEGMQPRAIEPAKTYEIEIEERNGDKTRKLTLTFTQDPDTGLYTMTGTISSGEGNFNNSYIGSIIIYDKDGNEVWRDDDEYNWQSSNKPITIKNLPIPVDGWIKLGVNGSQPVPVGEPDHVCVWQSGTPTLPTCVDRGYTTSKCSICDKEGPTTWTDPNGHAMVDTEKDPTCTVGGSITPTCSVCGKKDPTIPTLALGHSWLSLNDSSHQCQRCSEIRPHSIDITVSPNGVETWKCSDCNYEITKTPVNPGGPGSVNPDPGNPGNGLATIGDEPVPLGLDMVALRVLDENLRIINSLTLGDVLNDNLSMVSALEKDGYILELNFGALQYLSITYPSGKYVFLTDNLNAEIPFSLCSTLDGLAEYLQENVISADNAWLRVTFTQTSSGWNATMLAFDDGGQPLGYEIENAETPFFQIK